MKLMTEKEASKKICHVSMAGDDQLNCIAKDCMAWMEMGTATKEELGHCLVLDREE